MNPSGPRVASDTIPIGLRSPSMKRLLVLLAALGLTFATPLTAEASPSGCTTAYNQWTEWAYCPSGTGHYRVVGRMVNGTYYLTKYGPWVGIGSTSLISVPAGYRVYFVGIQFAA